MTLAQLIAREIAERKALLRLINAEQFIGTLSARAEIKLSRETLRATRSEIRRLRKTR